MIWLFPSLSARFLKSTSDRLSSIWNWACFVLFCFASHCHWNFQGMNSVCWVSSYSWLCPAGWADSSDLHMLWRVSGATLWWKSVGIVFDLYVSCSSWRLFGVLPHVKTPCCYCRLNYLVFIVSLFFALSSLWICIKFSCKVFCFYDENKWALQNL